MRFIEKDKKDSKADFLKRKFHVGNADTAFALESTRKIILDMLVPCWLDLKGEQKIYFEEVLIHNKKWNQIWEEENQV